MKELIVYLLLLTSLYFINKTLANELQRLPISHLSSYDNLIIIDGHLTDNYLPLSLYERVYLLADTATAQVTSHKPIRLIKYQQQMSGIIYTYGALQLAETAMVDGFMDIGNLYRFIEKTLILPLKKEYCLGQYEQRGNGKEACKFEVTSLFLVQTARRYGNYYSQQQQQQQEKVKEQQQSINEEILKEYNTTDLKDIIVQIEESKKTVKSIQSNQSKQNEKEEISVEDVQIVTVDTQSTQILPHNHQQAATQVIQSQLESLQPHTAATQITQSPSENKQQAANQIPQNSSKSRLEPVTQIIQTQLEIHQPQKSDTQTLSSILESPSESQQSHIAVTETLQTPSETQQARTEAAQNIQSHSETQQPQTEVTQVLQSHSESQQQAVTQVLQTHSGQQLEKIDSQSQTNEITQQSQQTQTIVTQIPQTPSESPQQSQQPLKAAAQIPQSPSESQQSQIADIQILQNPLENLQKIQQPQAVTAQILQNPLESPSESQSHTAITQTLQTPSATQQSCTEVAQNTQSHSETQQSQTEVTQILQSHSESQQSQTENNQILQSPLESQQQVAIQVFQTPSESQQPQTAEFSIAEIPSEGQQSQIPDSQVIQIRSESQQPESATGQITETEISSESQQLSQLQLVKQINSTQHLSDFIADHPASLSDGHNAEQTIQSSPHEEQTNVTLVNEQFSSFQFFQSTYSQPQININPSNNEDQNTTTNVNQLQQPQIQEPITNSTQQSSQSQNQTLLNEASNFQLQIIQNEQEEVDHQNAQSQPRLTLVTSPQNTQFQIPSQTAQQPENNGQASTSIQVDTNDLKGDITQELSNPDLEIIKQSAEEIPANNNQTGQTLQEGNSTFIDAVDSQENQNQPRIISSFILDLPDLEVIPDLGQTSTGQTEEQEKEIITEQQQQQTQNQQIEALQSSSKPEQFDQLSQTPNGQEARQLQTDHQVKQKILQPANPLQQLLSPANQSDQYQRPTENTPQFEAQPTNKQLQDAGQSQNQPPLGHFPSDRDQSKPSHDQPPKQSSEQQGQGTASAAHSSQQIPSDQAAQGDLNLLDRFKNMFF